MGWSSSDPFSPSSRQERRDKTILMQVKELSDPLYDGFSQERRSDIMIEKVFPNSCIRRMRYRSTEDNAIK